MPKYKLDEEDSGKIVKEALASGIPRDAIKVHMLGDIEVSDEYKKKFEEIVEKFSSDDEDDEEVKQ